MTRAASSPTQRRIFYGWWILVGATVIMALNGGLWFYGFSAFYPPLLAEFGWSRTALSGAFSLARLESGIMGPLAGFLVDHLGPRKLMTAGFTIMALGFYLLSRIDSLVMFYMVFIIFLSSGASWGMHSPVSTAVGNWFIRRRSTAMGIMMSGVGIGGAMVPLVAWLIERLGWRTAATVVGLFMWAIGMPVALLMRHRPEPYGYLPDGDTVLPATAGASAETKPALPSMEEVNFTARQALKTRAFWLIATSFTVRQAVTAAIAVHAIPLFIQSGFTAGAAATILGTMALVSVVGRLGLGRLGDFVDKRYILAGCYLFIIIGLFLLANASGWWQVVGFLGILAPAYGGSVSMMPAIRGEYFGRAAFATIQGFTELVTMVGTMGGPVLAGYVFDRTGSYRLAFNLFAAGIVGGIVAIMFTPRPPGKREPLWRPLSNGVARG